MISTTTIGTSLPLSAITPVESDDVVLTLPGSSSRSPSPNDALPQRSALTCPTQSQIETQEGDTLSLEMDRAAAYIHQDRRARLTALDSELEKDYTDFKRRPGNHRGAGCFGSSNRQLRKENFLSERKTRLKNEACAKAEKNLKTTAQKTGDAFLSEVPDFPQNKVRTIDQNSIDNAARKIQAGFRKHLRSTDFPRMLDGSNRLKELPKLVKKNNGRLLFGARPLSISDRPLGKGAYATVYAGTYNHRPVAVKIGRLPELTHLQPLLEVQQNHSIKMVVPIPVSVTTGREPSGVAIMPALSSDLKTYLRHHPNLVDQKRREQHKISDQLISCGVYHRDQTPENFLVNRNGEVSVADFGDIRVEKENPAPMFSPGLPLETILPPTHPVLKEAHQRSSTPSPRPMKASLFKALLTGLSFLNPAASPRR